MAENSIKLNRIVDVLKHDARNLDKKKKAIKLKN